jgi:hypothetical protein
MAAMRAMLDILVGGGVVLGMLTAATGCNVVPDTPTFETTPAVTSVSTGPSQSGTTADTGADTVMGSGTEEKLDTPFIPPAGGCQYVDFLFVIDNSASMATYQLALTEAFPGFVDAMFMALPPAIDVHVGLTTTDFDPGCDASEATQNCQSTATLPELESHYFRPDTMDFGVNGTQGELFEYSGLRYFEINSSDVPDPLTEWFTSAAVAAGEEGCSFEMPVAAAGFATHPANAETNEGFLRDAGGLFVIFFLTDEPDKSPESDVFYRDMVFDAKSECGGADCVFASGLIPPCVLPDGPDNPGGANQKLWQFMDQFDCNCPEGEECDCEDLAECECQDPPIWGDIELPGEYAMVFGDALAGAIAEACANVPAIP